MIYDTPSPVLIVLLLVAMIVTVETGIKVGERYGQRTWSNAHDIHTALTGATLALLGLMLAFTFNMSATRFDVRKNLIVTEAVAIQAVRSDLDFLTPRAQDEAIVALRRYAKYRVAFLEVGHNPQQESTAVLAAHAAQRVLWQLATQSDLYSSNDPQIRAAQYAKVIQAVTELNSVARQREAARTRRVPVAVLFMLFALAIGSGAVLAYISGASGHPDRPPTYIVLCLVCLVVYLIIDFDRPRRGLMQLDAGPLRETIVSL